MKYVLLAYRGEAQWNALTHDERLAFGIACASVEAELRLGGHLLAVGEPYERGSRIGVRIANGVVSLDEGSSGETQGSPRQVFFLAARDLNEAIRLAARLPYARFGHIEVGALTEFEPPSFSPDHGNTMVKSKEYRMKTTFTTTVMQEPGMNATGLPVPAEAIAALDSGKRPKVKVSLKGYTYRSTVAAYGDVYMLPLSQERRQAAGVQAGEQVEVTLELDLEPRLVELPDDLAAAFSQAGVRQAFDALSYTMRKEYVRQVESAKKQETRERRIEKIVDKLSGA